MSPGSNACVSGADLPQRAADEQRKQEVERQWISSGAGSEKTEIGAGRFIEWLDIAASKFYNWRERYGKTSNSFCLRTAPAKYQFSLK